MSDVVITVIIRGVLAGVIVLVGAWCVYLGTRLLFGRNQDRTKSAFEMTIGGHKLSFTAGAAGTAVVFTSAVWLFGAVYTAPTLSRSDGTSVAFTADRVPVDTFAALDPVATLTFRPDQITLTPTQARSLERALLTASTTSTQRFVIRGFAPSADQADAALAERRTEEVSRFLAKHGVEPAQIQVIAHAKGAPAGDALSHTVVVQQVREEPNKPDVRP